MEIKQLKNFVALAEELHFGRAAKRLEMAQPHLSLQISRLEKELNSRLFDRTKRSVELTRAGRLLLHEARLLLARADQARAIVASAKDESEQLIIGFVATADINFLPKVMAAYANVAPNTHLYLRQLNVPEQVAALKRGELDVGIVRLPLTDEALIVERVLSEPMVVALPANHKLASTPLIVLKDLAAEPYIFFPRSSAPNFYDLIWAICRKAGFAPNTAHEAASVLATLATVRAGLGLTLMPASVETLQIPGVVYRRLRPPAPEVEMGVAYRPEDGSAALSKFLDAIKMVSPL